MMIAAPNAIFEYTQNATRPLGFLLSPDPAADRALGAEAEAETPRA
jgi:hypothetical protein